MRTVAYDESIYMSGVRLDACRVETKGCGMLQMRCATDDAGKSGF